MGASPTLNFKVTDEDEKPAHIVSISSFSLGQYKVTQEEWMEVLDDTHSELKGAKRLVENVSLCVCMAFVHKLNSKIGMQSPLLTEVGLEFTACGSNKSKGFLYSGSNKASEVAWYVGNSECRAYIWGQKLFYE